MTAELAVRDNVTVMQRASTAYTLVEMRERVEQLDAFYRGLMQEGTDFGKIPGTDKPTLLQPGAQLACTYFGFNPTFEVLPASVEDWERGFFALTVRCRLMRQDGSAVADGIGSCNSKEDRYRWRDAQPVCPECGANAIRRSKQEWGGGFYCNQKSGGCNARFRGDSEAAAQIAKQPAGRIENPEPWSLHNTILKMAEKRAMVAATLNATGASRIFTQDVEDLPEFSRQPRPTIVDAAPAPEPEEAPPPPAPSPRMPTADQKAKFEENWKKGVAACIALGAEPPDRPKDGATQADLNKAQRELVETVKNRQALNDALAEKIALANEHGADYAVCDPSQMTAQEVHDQIAACDRFMDAAEQAEPDDDSEAF